MVRRVAAALITVACALVLAAPAGAHQLHLGVAAGIQGYSDPGAEGALIARTGTHWIREELRWSRVQTTQDGAFDWSAYDAFFAAMARDGLTVLPILDSPPCWAVASGPSSSPCATAYPDDAAFARFAAAAAARYGPGGTFWSQPGVDPGRAPRWFEVWNEPYLPQFTNGYVSSERYARLLHAAVTAGRAANPAARWIAEARYEVPTDVERPQETAPFDWAAGMRSAVPGIGADIEALAAHVYPLAHAPGDDPSALAFSLANVERVHASFAAQGIERPVWLTEFGYSSCADGATSCVPGGDQAAREQQKADWLGQLVSAAAGDRFGYVHAAFDYEWRQWSSQSSPTNEFDAWEGMRDQSGPLPALAAFTGSVAAFDGTPVPETTLAPLAADGDAIEAAFASDDASASFSCRLDAGAWSPCTGPARFGALAAGTHTVAVRAVGDEAADPTPATASAAIAPPTPAGAPPPGPLAPPPPASAASAAARPTAAAPRAAAERRAYARCRKAGHSRTACLRAAAARRRALAYARCRHAGRPRRACLALLRPPRSAPRRR